MNPQVSVVIPVYNEEEGLPLLFDRLYPAMDALRCRYEIVFVDDGSSDHSVAQLREQFQRRPDVTKVVVLARNAGQHLAILGRLRRRAAPTSSPSMRICRTRRRKLRGWSPPWMPAPITWAPSASAARTRGGARPPRG